MPPFGKPDGEVDADSSSDYNAAPGLEKISASLLASADDERNPSGSGLLVAAMRRVE